MDLPRNTQKQLTMIDAGIVKTERILTLAAWAVESQEQKNPGRNCRSNPYRGFASPFSYPCQGKREIRRVGEGCNSEPLPWWG